MFAWLGLLDPVITQPFRVSPLQLGVGVLHPLLGDELIVMYSFGVPVQLALAVPVYC